MHASSKLHAQLYPLNFRRRGTKTLLVAMFSLESITCDVTTVPGDVNSYATYVHSDVDVNMTDVSKEFEYCTK